MRSLLKLSASMLPQENTERVSEGPAREAFSLAVELSDKDRQAAAALMALEALIRMSGSSSLPETQEWVSRLERNLRNATDEVYLEYYKSLSSGPNPVIFHRHVRRAVELAMASEDNGIFFLAAGRAFGSLRALRDLDLRDRILNETSHQTKSGVPARVFGGYLNNSFRLFLERGDRRSAEACAHELSQLAERTKDATTSVLATIPPITLAYLEGHLSEALHLLDESENRAQAIGISAFAVFNSVSIRSRLHAYLGTLNEALLERIEGLGQLARPGLAAKALTLTFLGRKDEALTIRAQFGDIGADEDETAAAILAGLLESSILIGDLETTSAVRRRLRPLADRLTEVSISVGVEVSYGRLCGAASRSLGSLEDARECFLLGIRACQEVSFRPELALTRLAGC